MKLWQQIVGANEAGDWLVAAAIAAAVLILVIAFRFIASRIVASLSRKTETGIDDAIAEALRATSLVALFPLVLYAGATTLTLPPRAENALAIIAILGVLIQAGMWGNRFIVSWFAAQLPRKRADDPAGATAFGLLGIGARMVLWVLVLLLALGHLGFDITALVAGLGIGGIAVALAVQNILGDLFASLSIVLDKPFVVGDFVIVGDFLGTVERVGLKTTRLRSLGGELIVMSNADLLSSRIRNYKRMVERRVLFSVGVVYQTPAEKLARIPAWLRECVEAQPKGRFDRAHFKEYGDSALVFEIVYYVRDADYNVYMDTQQAINFAIFDRFAREGLEFAYPTRTLHISSMVAAPGANNTSQ